MINIIGFAVCVGILVIVHELGHMLVALSFRIKVKEFSIGFGPKLFSIVRGGTEYSLKSVPLGGYVKMLSVRDSDYSRYGVGLAFEEKEIYKRLLVLIAGPLINFVLAVLLIWVVTIKGSITYSPVVEHVIIGSPAYSAGIRNGELIRSVNGVDIKSTSSLRYELVRVYGNTENVDFEVENLESKIVRSVRIKVSSWKELNNNRQIDSGFGLVFNEGRYRFVESCIKTEGDAHDWVLKGDKILKVNGLDATRESRLVVAKPSSSGAISLLVLRGGVERELSIPINSRNPKELSEILYAELKTEPVQERYLIRTNVGIVEGLQVSFEKTISLGGLIFSNLKNIFLDTKGDFELSGMVSIAKNSGEALEGGVYKFVAFVALMSVNLAVFNLLPLPVLDGGGVLLLSWEAVTKRPVSEKATRILTMGGVGLVAGMIVVGLVNDFLNYLPK